MRLIRFAASLYLAFFWLCAQSQERPLGTWKVFMPYGASVGLAKAGSLVYSGTNKSVFSYHRADGTVRTYDKANGLSDVGVKTIGYDETGNVLVIAYTNSNLDLIFNSTDIYNLPDIKKENLSGAVGINHIYFSGGNCYVSTDLGISVINLSKKEVSNTFVIGSGGGQTRVFATALSSATIYAATQQGLKFASRSATNLQDFNAWSTVNAGEGLPVKKTKNVAVFQNKIYAVVEGSNSTDTLYEYNGSNWLKIFYSSKNTITSLQVTDNALYFTAWDDSSGNNGKNGKITAQGVQTVNPSQGHVRPVGWFEADGWSWEADSWNGLFKNNQQGYIENIVPDGPFSAAVYKMEIKEGKLFMAPGGVDDSWGFVYNYDGFSILENNAWTKRNLYTDPQLSGFSDILSVASVPARGKTYFGSFFAGLIEYDNATKSIVTYNKWNSILEGALGDTPRTKISSMTTDIYNNVWIGNAGATRPIKVIRADGSWRDFSIPYNISVPKRLLMDRNDQLWIPLRSTTQGLLVWRHNNTLDDPTDDQSRLLLPGTGNGNLPDAVVYSIAEDKEGNIWVGTGAGIAVFYCPGSVLSQNGCSASQIKVERDGYIGYLFGSEQVRAIAVDAANRKWIGTTNGLWLISDDGKEELLKFNTDNSPLPTNQVTDIAIDDQTGEVYIGTTGGLVSYQGDAIGLCADCDGALVYPNPVPYTYDGPIAIKGLSENAYVKITDISGTLIHQGKANGSQMIWDGKNYKGERAATGVYLVFSSTDLGKERKVAKILLTN